ncbi:MAG TPA: hypothetical protein VHR47_06905 [Bacillota bacterium]|nr:hypothetical protein [Bacillota bacterium]
MKKTLGIAMIILVALGISVLSLAAPATQTVTVRIPDVSMITLSANNMLIAFDPIDQWTSDSATEKSDSFDIITRHNGTLDPDVTVSSTDLTNGSANLDRSQFKVFVKPADASTEQSGSLDNTVTVQNVGKGRKTASAYYQLTLGADQQSGEYTGTVTYTLVNQ